MSSSEEVSNPGRRDKMVWRVLTGMTVVVLFVAVYHAVLFGSRQFAFRDAAFFYVPMFQEIQNRWDRGELPLWDASSNLGQPMAGNPTASVFYPVKLVFFASRILPIDYHACYKIYTLFHVVWGFLGMYLLLRWWRFSKTASTLAAMSFMFGGSVLMLYCNLIFLIGASWLPWVIHSGDRLLRNGTPVAFLALSVTLAMTVLAGEPQSGYCAGLMLAGLAFVYWRADRRRNSGDRAQFRLWKSWGALLLAGGAAAALAAIQILPSGEFARHSDRTLSDMPYSVLDAPPRSLWEIPGYVKKWNAFPNGQVPENIVKNRPNSCLTGIVNGIFCQTLEAGHAHDHSVYSYAVMPLEFGSLAYSNLGGRICPQNGKWMPSTAWFDSLYMGAFILPLALIALSFWGGRRRNGTGTETTNETANGSSRSVLSRRTLAVWASWVLLLAVWASLGGYGPQWFARAIANRGQAGIDFMALKNGDPVGGLYWLMNVLLPGFVHFRYSAKMMLFVVFALAVLAGIGWDCCRRRKRLRGLIRCLSFFAAVGILLVACCGSRLFELDYPGDTSVGMYNAKAAWHDVFYGLVQTFVVLYLFQRFIQSKRLRPALGFLVVAMLAADLYMANAGIVATAPREFYTQRSPLAEAIEKHDSELYPKKPIAPPRIYTMEWFPLVLTKRSEPLRDFDHVLWDHMTMLPNHHYLQGMQNAHSLGTMTIDEYRFFLSWANMPYDYDISPVTSFLDIRALVLPRIMSLSDGEQPGAIKLDSGNMRLLVAADKSAKEVLDAKGIPNDVALWGVVSPTSRVKIFHDRPELDDPLFNVFHMVRSGRIDGRLESEYATITRYGHNALELEVKLTKPGDVVLAEQYFPGWRATAMPLDGKGVARDVGIRKTLGFMRRLSLAPGSYRIEMKYCPASFRNGATISGLAWLVALILLGFAWRRSRANRVPSAGACNGST